MMTNEYHFVPTSIARFFCFRFNDLTNVVKCGKTYTTICHILYLFIYDKRYLPNIRSV